MLKVVRVLILIGAVSVVALGSLGGGLGIVLSLLNTGADQLIMLTFSVSLLLLTGGLGSALAWHAWRAIQEYPSTPFRPRIIWPLGLLFVMSVIVGQVVLALDLLPALTFPLFHVAAATLPPLIILALVGRSLGGSTTWRDMVLQTGGGAFLSTTLAFLLEAIFILSLVTGTLVGVAIQPGGPELLQAVLDYIQDPVAVSDLVTQAPSIMSPIILVVALVIVAGLIPLIEESVKTIGVGLMAYRRPSLSQAFLWGLAGGAGFALVEGLFNTTNGLEAWGLVISLRVGATLLHCFTGALMGLAWYNALAERRRGRALGLFAASVALHSLWNATSFGMILLSLGTIGAETTTASAAFAGLGTLLLLSILALSMGFGLAGLTRYVRKNSSAPNLTPRPAAATTIMGEGQCPPG